MSQVNIHIFRENSLKLYTVELAYRTYSSTGCAILTTVLVEKCYELLDLSLTSYMYFAWNPVKIARNPKLFSCGESQFIFCFLAFRKRRSFSWDSSKGKGNHKTFGGQKSGNDENFNMPTTEWGQLRFRILILAKTPDYRFLNIKSPHSIWGFLREII